MADGNGMIPINLGWLVNSSSFSYCFQLFRGSLMCCFIGKLTNGNNPCSSYSLWACCVKAMTSKTQKDPFAHGSSYARSACQAPTAKREVWYQGLKGIQASLQMLNKDWNFLSSPFWVERIWFWHFPLAVFYLWLCTENSVFLLILDTVINNLRILLHFKKYFIRVNLCLWHDLCHC